MKTTFHFQTKSTINWQQCLFLMWEWIFKNIHIYINISSAWTFRENVSFPAWQTLLSSLVLSPRKLNYFLIRNVIWLHGAHLHTPARYVIFSSSLLLQPFSPQNLVDLQPTGSIIQEEGLHDFPSNTKIVAENEKNWYKQFAR